MEAVLRLPQITQVKILRGLELTLSKLLFSFISETNLNKPTIKSQTLLISNIAIEGLALSKEH